MEELISKPVILVGMPKAGKTTLGNALASKLHLDFYDSDALLSKNFGLTIPELYSKLGEKKFRTEESKIIFEVLAQKKPCLLATGGGAIEGDIFFDLKQECVVYVKAELHLLLSRVLEAGKLKGSFPQFFACGPCDAFLKPDCGACLEKKLNALYQKRKPLYETLSKITINVIGNIEQDLICLTELLNEKSL